MAESLSGGRLHQLSRHPLLIDAVRVASLVTVCDAEVIAFDGHRGVVVGALTPSIHQPRPLSDAEQAVRDGAASSVIDQYSAVAIRPRDGETVGSLTVAAAVDESAIEVMSILGRLVESAWSSPSSPALDDESDRPLAILHGIRDLIVVVNDQLEVTWCNQSLGAQLGWSEAELLGTDATWLVHADDLAEALDAIVRLRAGHELYQIALRLRHARGDYERMTITGMDWSDDPRIGGLVLSIRGDDRKAEVERELETNRRRSDAIVRDLRDGVVATDEAGAIRLMNTTARALFGIESHVALAATTLTDLPLLDADGQPLPEHAHPLLPGSITGAVSFDGCIMSPTGLRHVDLRAEHVESDDDHLGMVLVIHDTTDAREADARLISLALQDQLTGLANRRHLRDRLEGLRSSSGPGRITACFIDLDGFKYVNDVHGHRVGDAILCLAGERLTSQLSATDFLARQGGDEFVALMFDDGDDADLRRRAEAMRATLADPYVIDDVPHHMTASIGTASAPLAGFDHELLLQQADIALYVAKANGRDRVEVFDQALAVRTETEQRHREMIRDCLEGNRLEMHLQPIVDSDTGRFVGAESLARIRADNGLLVGPGAMIDSVVGTSLIIEFDHRAFELSCEAARRLTTVYPSHVLWISCNFSGTTLMQPDLVDRVMGAVHRIGVRPERICIEVLESDIFDTADVSIRALRELSAMGFRIALDDFGTGYSSLAHLRDLPLSTVKVDRSFIIRLTGGGHELAITQAMVNLAGALGFGVIAEGVETAEQLAAARAIGFRTIQGWYYGQAESLDEFIEMLRADLDVPIT
jgi:diguanylate cyclase (GGDEF)-like protein/PAS domain S-box-containing protein